MHAPSQANTGRIVIPDGSNSAVMEIAVGSYLFKADWPSTIAFFATEALALAADDPLDVTAVRPWPPGGPAAAPSGLGRSLVGDAYLPISVTEGLRFFVVTLSTTPPATAHLEWGPG